MTKERENIFSSFIVAVRFVGASVVKEKRESVYITITW